MQICSNELNRIDGFRYEYEPAYHYRRAAWIGWRERHNRHSLLNSRRLLGWTTTMLMMQPAASSIRERRKRERPKIASERARGICAYSSGIIVKRIMKNQFAPGRGSTQGARRFFCAIQKIAQRKNMDTSSGCFSMIVVCWPPRIIRDATQTNSTTGN